MRCEGLWWQNVGISNGLTHRTYYFRRVRMQLMMRKVCGRPTNAAVDQWREQQAGGAEVNTHTQIQILTCAPTLGYCLKRKAVRDREIVLPFLSVCVCVRVRAGEW